MSILHYTYVLFTVADKVVPFAHAGISGIFTALKIVTFCWFFPDLRGDKTVTRAGTFYRL